jgi:iron complex outermembrane receptor protein
MFPFVPDGLPLNQADGEAFLHDIDLRTLKYIQVYRGADALRYGGVTLGGAVNMVTMTGRDAPPLEAWFTAGSFGFFNFGALSGWSNASFDMFLDASNQSTDGFRDHSQENTQKVFLSLGQKLGDNAENRLSFSFDDMRQNNPASLTKQQMYSNPQQTTPESIAQNWDTNWSYFRVADRFALKGDGWSFQLGVCYSYRDQFYRQEWDDDSPIGIRRFFSNDFGADASFESTAELFGQRNRLSLGFMPTYERQRDASFANPDGNAGPIVAMDHANATNLNLYAENQHYFTDRFSILTGLQLLYAGRGYEDQLKVAADGDQSNDETYRTFNPKLGALYEWNDQIQSYINFSRSFQPAGIDESVQIADDGDHLFNRLEAQHAFTLEGGTRGKFGPISWDLAVYHSWIREELLDLTDGHGNALGTVNANRTYHQGIEAEIEIELAHGLFTRNASHTDKLTLQQTYTSNDFRFDGDPVYGNNRIAGIPVHYYKAQLLYENPCGFYCGPNVKWNITKYPVDEANTLDADPYALLNFEIGYKSPKGFRVYLDAENLTDEVYAATVEPVGDARLEGYDSFNPGNGRAYYGGVSWIW